MERLQELIGAVARGWCHPETEHKEMDTVLAEAIVDEVFPLLVRNDSLIETSLGTANLGLATTRELIEELTARIDTDYVMGGGGLDYTTVDGRPIYRRQSQ